MDFREQVVEHSVFSDGAGAAIVSTTKGPFRVKKAVANIFPSLGEKFSIDVYGHLQVDLSFERSVAVPRLTELLAELRPLLSDNALFVDSQLTPESFRLLESAVGYGNWYSSFSEFGNMFGASPFAAIASLKERGEMDAEHIVLIQSGIGLSVGVVILEREA
jgi:3-oxoacyl-[acyl-carrier-protein] synthase III